MGCILPGVIFGHVLLQRHVRLVSFSAISHLVMRCSRLKVLMGDKRRCGRNDSQCSSGNYLLILVSAEKVRIELVDLKVCVNSVSATLQVG